MSLEGLLERASEAVRCVTKMGTTPAQQAASQIAGNLQSIYNALASQVQSDPSRLSSGEKHLVFELACRIWVRVHLY